MSLEEKIAQLLRKKGFKGAFSICYDPDGWDYAQYYVHAGNFTYRVRLDHTDGCVRDFSRKDNRC